jgi:hypothetical protein
MTDFWPKRDKEGKHVTNITKLPDSEDNDPVVKLIKRVTDACYNYDGELTTIEIVGVLEAVKHQVLFDDAIESVEWEE